MRPLLLFIACTLALPVLAHHSFAVYFVPDKTVSVQGTVTEFRFMNPHGLLYFETPDRKQWKAETNAPNILMRRGWRKDSIRAGDKVTVEGYPARDGSNFMRIMRVVFADGRVLPGQARDASGPAKD